MTPPELRQARRAFVRAHHPDRGGDPLVFAEGLARFDRLTAATSTGAAPTDPRPRVVVIRRRRALPALLHAVRRATTARRRRPPPRVR